MQELRHPYLGIDNSLIINYLYVKGVDQNWGLELKSREQEFSNRFNEMNEKGVNFAK